MGGPHAERGQLVHRRYSCWNEWAREFISCSIWECYERGSS